MDIELVPLGGGTRAASQDAANKLNANEYELVPLFAKAPDIYQGSQPVGELPEITDQSTVPWFKSLGTDLKLMTTSEEMEKARILKKAFPDRTEISVDSTSGKPVVSLDGKSFVMNKEGMSAQDLNDFVAETGQFLPASLLSGGAGLLGRLGMGLLSYGATESAREFATTLSGGKDPGESAIDLVDVATTAGIGGTLEAVSPPMFKLLGRAFNAAKNRFGGTNEVPDEVLKTLIKAASDGDEQGLYRAITSAQGGDSGGIPLTQGQKSGSLSALETESMMREGTGAYGEGATNVMRGADNRQMDVILNQAGDLQSDIGRGTGFAPEAPSEIGGRLQGDLIEREASENAAAGAAMEAGKEAMKTSPVAVPGDVFKAGILKLRDIPREFGIGPQLLNEMPQLKIAMTRIRTFAKAAERGRVRAADYSKIVDARETLQTQIDSVRMDSKKEKAALIKMVNSIDETIDDMMTNGLAIGDPETINVVRSGNKAWSQYKKKFFPGKGDRFGNKDVGGKALTKILGDEPPERVANMLFSISKAAPSKERVQLIKRVKNIFGDDSEQMKLIKDGFIYRMFTNTAGLGKEGVTRTSIVKNFREAFEKSPTAAKQLFTEKEIVKIRKFVGRVSRTMPAEMSINPSGTGRFMARFFTDMTSGGFMARIGSSARGLPFVGGAGEKGYARALAYANILSTSPLGAAGVAAIDTENPDSAAQSITRGVAQSISDIIPKDEY